MRLRVGVGLCLCVCVCLCVYACVVCLCVCVWLRVPVPAQREDVRQVATAALARMATHIAASPGKDVIGIALRELAGPVLADPHTWDYEKIAINLPVSRSTWLADSKCERIPCLRVCRSLRKRRRMSPRSTTAAFSL